MPIATPQGTLDFKSVDKVTFVGASSNTVIDTTTGSLGVGVGVGGPTSNLHVVGDTLITGNVSDLNIVSNVNMLHTANTASIKLNSNVVTEFPRSKKLIRYPRVALTAASGESSGYQGYYVTESSNSADTDRHSWKAFNMTFGTDTADDAWANDQLTTTYNGTDNAYNGSINLGTGAVNGEWIKLQLPHKIKLEYMKIWLKDNDPTRIPEDWILYGSNDNTNWTELFSKTGQAAINENQYSVNATSVYDYFAVVVTKISGQNNYFRIVELEYFGVPEYDPEAHGTDVVVKSVPNVPNTDWLEVYYDAKGLQNGAVTNPISGLGGTTINGTATNVTVSDGAFVFDGSSTYMTGGTTSISGNHHHSFSCWLKPTSANSGYRCIGYLFYSGSNNTTTGLFLNNNRPVFLTWGNNLIADHTLVQNEWVHVTAVYDGTGRTIYVNSKQVDSDAYSSYNINASATLFVGASTTTPGEVFGGSMANFRLFNRALTTDEIYQLYAYQKEYFGHGDLSMTLKNGRLGIGTSEPRAALDVRGDVQVGGIITSNNPAFHVYRDAGDITTSDTLIVWNQVRFNRGSCYDSSTGIFRPPVDGMYYFSVFGMSDAIDNPVVSFRFEHAPPGETTFTIIGALWPYQFTRSNSGTTHGGVSGSFVYYLEAGSQFRVLFHGTELLARGNSHNGFSGFLIG